MGHPMLTASSTLLCAHGMPAMPIAGDARVKVSGVPVLRVGDAVVANNCNGETPCVMFRAAESTRVRASGQPLAVATTVVSVANGLRAMIVATQQRLKAQ